MSTSGEAEKVADVILLDIIDVTDAEIESAQYCNRKKQIAAIITHAIEARCGELRKGEHVFHHCSGTGGIKPYPILVCSCCQDPAQSVQFNALEYVGELRKALEEIKTMCSGRCHCGILPTDDTCINCRAVKLVDKALAQPKACE